MSKNEAEQVIAILLTADGGCSYCVRELVIKFEEQFPEYTQITDQKYIEKFGVGEFQFTN